MAVERVIDYIAFSAEMLESNCIIKQFEPVPPVRFYTRGYRDKYGIRYYFGSPKTKKAFVVASGQVMETLRSLRNDYEILCWAFEAGAKFSRLDLAVTEWQTLDGMVFVEDIEEWVRNGLVETSLLSGGVHEVVRPFGKKGLQRETLYIGDPKKRASKGIFRAYDKGIELDIGAYIGTRLELELKREKANKAAERIAASNDIAGNFRAYFNVKHRDFDRLMDADAVSTRRGKAKEKVEESEAMAKRWEWLIKQVAPSLEDAVKYDRVNGLGNTNLIRFMEASGLLGEQTAYARELAEFMFKQLAHKRNTLAWD